MRDFEPNPTPAVADYWNDPARRSCINRWGPPHPEPGTSLWFDPANAERTAQIVKWAAAPDVVGATLDGTASGGVECVLWIRTPADGAQPVPHGKCLYRGADGYFSVVANAEADAALAELARLCEGVDPFASSFKTAPRPSTRDT